MKIDLQIKDTVINPNNPRAVKKLEGNYKIPKWKTPKTLYQVWIYLEGKDLPLVKSVTYTLHSSFKNRTITVKRSFGKDNFSLMIWTWGTFLVKVKIQLVKDNVLYMNHYLTYGNQLKDRGISWSKIK